VRRLVFLSILRDLLLLSQTCRLVRFQRTLRVFPQPGNRALQSHNRPRKLYFWSAECWDASETGYQCV